jgi:O-antigen ligase
VTGITVPAAVACVLAWGVVPFGAVHDWALWPLLLGTALTGLVCSRGQQASVRVLLAALPIVGASLVQIAPIPDAFVATLPCANTRFLRDFDLGFAAAAAGYHSTSVSEDLTGRAILAYTAFALFAAGLSAQLRFGQNAAKTARIVGALAVVVALFAIVQKATFNGKIYWFWESAFRGTSNYYGPFVNRNHFAGWMLLASALTAGYLLGQVATTGRRAKAGWRNRILWLSSEEAGRIAITAVALLVMLVSIMWSMSRSGIGGTALALLILCAAATIRLRNRARRASAALSVLIVLFAAVAWRGTDVLADWYGRTQTFEWRIRLWDDTLPALKDFWLMGSGLNTYGVVMRLYPQTDQSVHAVQAHSDYLQLAVEGGLLVGIPVLITLALLIRTMARRLRQPQSEETWWIRMGAVAGICGMALQETTEFSLQIPGVALLFAVLIAVAIHEPAVHPRAAVKPSIQELEAPSHDVGSHT